MSGGSLVASVSACSSGFHPTQFDGGGIELRGWFDPRDPSTQIFTSGRLTSFLNKVSGTPVLEVGTQGPAVANTLNGGPCLVGAGAQLMRSVEAGLLDMWSDDAGDSLHTLCWLMEPTTGAPFGVGNAAEAFNESSWVGTGYSRSQGGTCTWGGADPVTGVNALSVAYLGSGSDPEITLNQVPQTVSVLSGTPPKLIANPDQFMLLGIPRAIPGSLYVGKLGPVLLYKGALSPAQQLVANAGLRRWYDLAP